MFIDRPVGIDLGTTNSEIAQLEASERDVVLYVDKFGRRTVPSAVAWDGKAFVVGHAARQRRTASEPPVESIKRKMGQKARVKIGPDELSPEEVSAKILSELVTRMREQLLQKNEKGAPEPRVTRAVITVPAYFDAPQVEATRRAGELAGIEVIGVLQEPTAAAIYHTWKRKLGDGNFLVYDLGGGTFDVSVLRCVGGEYQVLAIDGDNFLGGDDLDRRFAEWIRKELVKKGYSLDLDVVGDPADRARFMRIVNLAQDVKESFSTTEVVHVAKNDVLVDKAGETVSFEADLGRADYESIVGDLVETTLACCRNALERAFEVAKVGADDIDHVVLVGGSTRVPLVVRRVTEELCKKGREPLRDDVDTCVALGAAIHAAHLGGHVVGDENAQIVSTGALVTHGDKIKLSLFARKFPEKSKTLAVWLGEDLLGEIPVPSTSPVKMEITLGEEVETKVTLGLQSAVGAPLAELPLTLYRGDLRPRPTALSRAAVVAKDIALEVVRGGRRDRRVLIARGTGLPTQATQIFYTADQSGGVVLRILQNRLPIKQLVVDVPKGLPVGTPLELTLRCDESMRMEAKAIVGQTQIEALIAPEESATTRPDVEKLLDEAERAKRGLWGGLGAMFQRDADKLVLGIREATLTDPDKLDALCLKLRHLIDELAGSSAEELVPPLPRYEEALDSLRRIVYRTKGMLVGMTRAEWEERVDEVDARARKAYEAHDGTTWRRCFNEVQALLETAWQEEFSAMRLDDPTYVQKRVSRVVNWAHRVEHELADQALTSEGDLRKLQEAEISRIRSWYEADVRRALTELEKSEGDPDAVRKKADAVGGELERIEAALERVPQIGMVTDRGGAGGAGGAA